ncbi:MAG TPA: hypothetical protein VFG73_06340 [Rhodanobacteraceae bacterium]|nr:hypothetical protein [Rhodanobacteraceae bacterium]
MPNLLRAIVELGLPVAGLSWLLFYRLYHRGELAREADRKSIRASLKQLRKDAKNGDGSSDHALHQKWMKFGGGFYGVAALWTLIVIEVSGVAGTIAHPSSIAAMFEGGVVKFLVDWVIGQATTFVQAIMWFNWWAGETQGAVVWFLVAMAGYVAGLEVARHETALGHRLVDWNWRTQVRAWFGPRKDS